MRIDFGFVQNYDSAGGKSNKVKNRVALTENVENCVIFA
jgi:hypothetical protein